MSTEEAIERLKHTGRNDQCPCGSGKKYKKCHLAADTDVHQKVLEAEREAAQATADDADDDIDVKPVANPSGFKGDSGTKVKANKSFARRNIPRRQAGI